ncbi:MAG: T9SS type A sorting domain-containing protein, partial [Bacteroidetes bacterium]|nr:T9SS type A sorting domain-containing protein [Bacteroidota bacterium]
DIMISPVNSSVVYAATSQNGVYISADAGLSWEPSNDSLVAEYITAFSRSFLDPDNIWHFCASSFSNSAFKTSIYNPSTDVPVTFDISPTQWLITHPSHNQFMLRATLRSESEIELKLFDSNGRQLVATGKRKLGKGNYTWEFNEKPGLYLLQISENGKKRTEKVIIF